MGTIITAIPTANTNRATISGINRNIKYKSYKYDKLIYTDRPNKIDSTITLSIARYNLAATSVGNYALFGGGYDINSIKSNIVDTYNASLVHSLPAVLTIARRELAATNIGDYALFGGGNNSNTIDVYTD